MFLVSVLLFSKGVPLCRSNPIIVAGMSANRGEGLRAFPRFDHTWAIPVVSAARPKRPPTTDKETAGKTEESEVAAGPSPLLTF